MIEAKFVLRPKKCWAQELSEKFPEMRMVVFSTHEDAGLSRWYGSKEDLRGAIGFSRRHGHVSSLSVLSREKEEAVVRTVCRCPLKSQVHSILARHGCFYSLPDPIVTFRGGKHYRIIAPDNEALRRALVGLRRIGSLALEGVVEYRERNESFFINVKEMSDSLTEKQRRSLREAFRGGYFNIPKKTSVRELSKKIGIAESTLQEQVAEAERKIISFFADYI